LARSKSAETRTEASDSVDSQAAGVSSGPTFVVEASLAAVVTPKLQTWLEDLSGAIPRVMEKQDGEAVHDLRVAIRRIRSLLRVVRPVFGRFHVTRIRQQMQRVASATGQLRDEEVLAETLDALALEPALRAGMGTWLQIRQQRERELREGVIRILSARVLDMPRQQLQALLILPPAPGRDKEAYRFAKRVVIEAQRRIEALRTADVADVQGMHDLRIAYKRLRYAVEALSPVLPPELRAWGQVATTFQKILGNLHDHDVAMDTLRAAAELSESTRVGVMQALQDRRVYYAQRYLAEVGFEVASGAVTPETTESRAGEETEKASKSGS